jgi:hypothetical protein
MSIEELKFELETLQNDLSATGETMARLDLQLQAETKALSIATENNARAILDEQDSPLQNTTGHRIAIEAILLAIQITSNELAFRAQCVTDTKRELLAVDSSALN